MADHRDTHEKVAIKKIIDVFRSASDARCASFFALLGSCIALTVDVVIHCVKFVS